MNILMLLAKFANLGFMYYLEQTAITIGMVILATFFAYLIGIPLGIILNVTDKNGLFECKWLNLIIGFIVNILRSAPFIILLVTILPAIRSIVGTGTGNVPFVVALVIAACPFVARMVESSLKEVDYGIIEASSAMGASRIAIIFKVILPEIKSSLIVGVTISFATILGYTAMTGIIGADGLGNVAYSYGYIRNYLDAKLISLALLIIIVQVFQELGMLVAKKIDHRKKGE